MAENEYLSGDSDRPATRAEVMALLKEAQAKSDKLFAKMIELRQAKIDEDINGRLGDVQSDFEQLTRELIAEHADEDEED